MKHALAGIVALVVAAGLAAGCGSSSGVGNGLPGSDGGSQDGTVSCGGSGEPCCNGIACNGGLTCSAGACAPSISADATLDAGTLFDVTILLDDGLPDSGGSVDSSYADAGLPDGSGADALLPRTPQQHRAASSSCPQQRGPGRITGVTSPTSCSVDSDCTTAILGSNGRCFDNCGPPGCAGTVCSYDKCFTNADCPAKIPCQCRSSASDNAANYCVTGSQCAVDADCGPGGYCSPSRLLVNCDLAYFCHSPNDACVDDSDCAPPGLTGQCNYDPQAGHWACRACTPPQ